MNCALTLQDAPSFLESSTSAISPSLQRWNSSFLRRRTDDRSACSFFGLVGCSRALILMSARFRHCLTDLIKKRGSSYTTSSTILLTRLRHYRLVRGKHTSGWERFSLPAACDHVTTFPIAARVLLIDRYLHRHTSHDRRARLRSQPLRPDRQPDACVGPGHCTEHRRSRCLVRHTIAPIHDEHRCP